MWRKLLLNRAQFPACEAVVLTKRRRTSGAVQIKQSFFASANDMHMLRKMVVGIDDDQQAIYTQNRRHRRRIAYS
jgi:hypothetical protein